MIHITTVHFEDASWIDIQQKYLEKFISAPFKVYASLEGIDKSDSHEYFYKTYETMGRHHTKLNVLADMVMFASDSDEDIIIFIDGDAFPIAPIDGFIEKKLEEFPLLAIQRLENNGDVQPHPCFAVTTVGFWKKIKGDWNKGYAWLDAEGNKTTDTGGNLLGILEQNKIEWHPMLRSNRTNLHPLLFGIYGDLIYHHGAGFRDAVLRMDDPLHKARGAWIEFLKSCPNSFGLYRAKSYLHSAYKEYECVKKENKRLSDDVFNSVRDDEEFFKKFI